MDEIEQAEYAEGAAAGRQDYRQGYTFLSTGTDAYRQGYTDGFSGAQDEAVGQYGHAFACELSFREGGVERYESGR